MSNIIVKDLSNDTLQDITKGFIHAFPHWKYNDAREIVLEQQQDNEMKYLAAYIDDRYAGLAVVADITMNFHGKSIRAIELDHLHTDLLAKKKGVSSELIKKSCEYALDIDVPIMFVGPFSTKFYRNKGFGYGIQRMMFESEPHDFRFYGMLESLEYLTIDDKQELSEFIARCYLSTKGNITFKNSSLKDYYEKLLEKEHVTVVYKKDNAIHGYLTYKNSNDIVVHGMLYDTPDALHALSSFLHSQKGQVNNIRFEFSDTPTMMVCDRPKNVTYEEFSMVKILDTKKFFNVIKEHEVNFNNETLNLHIKTHDRLTGKTSETTISFKDGMVQNIGDNAPDVTISLDVSDFSSLVIGRISFCDLISSGLVEVTCIDYIDILNRLFYTDYIPLIKR